MEDIYTINTIGKSNTKSAASHSEPGDVSSGGTLASSLSTLPEHLGRLVSTDTSTPLTTVLIVLVREVSLGGTDEGSKLPLVLAADLLESNDSGSLFVDDSPETGLALDDHVGDAHLAAESRQEDDELDGVDVMGDDDEGSLLSLDEGDDVVQTVLGEQRLLGIGLSFPLSGSNSGLLETSCLLLLALRTILVQELEQLSSSVLVQCVGELGNSRGNLETLAEDDLLALETDVLGPFHEAGQISLGLDVLADTKIFCVSLKERVFLGLGGLCDTVRSGCDLLSGLGFGGLVIETKESAKPIMKIVLLTLRSSSVCEIRR
jgi:hypothetical protein